MVASGPAYRPRGSPDTLLHRVVREHLEEFLQLTREQHDKPLPRYVVREFQEYLRCGDLSLGFIRARIRRTVRSVTSKISSTSIQLIFPAIALKIKSFAFITRSLSFRL
jgi:hypothetical protein